MEFRLLGPLAVLVDGRPLAVGGPKQRAALAMLLLNANVPVSRDRLLEAVWGEEPPTGARRSLDSYLSRLRGLLGEDRVVRQAAGYVLRVRPGELDLERFDALVEQAAVRSAADDAHAASAELRTALALWRGAALGDLASEPVGRGHVHELEERRLHALEQCADADLALGAGPALVPELQRLALGRWRLGAGLPGAVRAAPAVLRLQRRLHERLRVRPDARAPDARRVLRAAAGARASGSGSGRGSTAGSSTRRTGCRP